MVVAFGLQIADGFVYRAPHVFQPEQPLGVGWPIAAILSVGRSPVVRGRAASSASSSGSAARCRPSPTVARVDPADALRPRHHAAQLLSLVTTTMLYVFAGGVGGYLAQLIRRTEARTTAAERQLADARAREDVARRLHDGVLQTLALVERRTDDPALARLARDQERDLRGYLLGPSAPGTDAPDRVVGRGALGDALRAVAGRHETTHGGRVDVLVPDDLPDLDAGGGRRAWLVRQARR